MKKTINYLTVEIPAFAYDFLLEQSKKENSSISQEFIKIISTHANSRFVKLREADKTQPRKKIKVNVDAIQYFQAIQIPVTRTRYDFVYYVMYIFVNKMKEG